MNLADYDSFVFDLVVSDVLPNIFCICFDFSIILLLQDSVDCHC